MGELFEGVGDGVGEFLNLNKLMWLRTVCALTCKRWSEFPVVLNV